MLLLFEGLGISGLVFIIGLRLLFGVWIGFCGKNLLLLILLVLLLLCFFKNIIMVVIISKVGRNIKVLRINGLFRIDEKLNLLFFLIFFVFCCFIILFCLVISFLSCFWILLF